MRKNRLHMIMKTIKETNFLKMKLGLNPNLICFDS